MGLQEFVRITDTGLDRETGDVLFALETDEGDTQRIVLTRPAVAAAAAFLTAVDLTFPPAKRGARGQPLMPTGARGTVTPDGIPAVILHLHGGLELPLLLAPQCAKELREALDTAIAARAAVEKHVIKPAARKKAAARAVKKSTPARRRGSPARRKKTAP